MLMSSPIRFSGAIYNISWYLLRASKDQDYRDSNSNWIRKAKRKKKKEEYGEGRIIQGYTAGYWQKQEKNLGETESNQFKYSWLRSPELFRFVFKSGTLENKLKQKTCNMFLSPAVSV